MPTTRAALLTFVVHVELVGPVVDAEAQTFLVFCVNRYAFPRVFWNKQPSALSKKLEMFGPREACYKNPGSEWIRVDQGGSQPGEGRSTLIRRGSRRSSRKTRDEAPRPVGVRGGSLATRCRQRVDRSAWIRVDQSGSGRFPAGGGRIHPDPAWITRRSSRRTRDKGPRPVGVRGGSSARHVASEWTGARGSEWIRVDQGGS